MNASLTSMLRIGVFLCLSLSTTTFSFAQICTVYEEDFDGDDGEGLVGPGAPPAFISPTGGWMATGGTLTATSDWFQVVNGQMEARDVDSPVCWSTPEFINSPTLCYEYFRYSFDASEVGTMESADFLNSDGIIGGVSIPGANFVDDFISASFTSADLSLDCTDPFFAKITILNNAGGERHRFDNFLMEACKAPPTLVSAVPTCSGADGTITVSATLPACSNGTLEYRIDGGPWQTSNVFTPLSSADYTVDVRNSELPDCCFETTTVTVACMVVCGFNVTCPASTALGPFACDATLPLCPTLETEAAAAPYNIDFSANIPCGTTVVLCADVSTPDLCAGYTITRTVTVFDDLDGNGLLDPGEDFVDCTFTLPILPPGGPTIVCPAAALDCSMAPDPIIYIGSSDNGDNAADECVIGGEYVEICSTDGCPGCPAVATDLSGWEIEDAASVDGSPETTIIIDSGSLLPDECVLIYSGYLTGNIPGNPVGTMGSVFMVSSDRLNPGNDCRVWNNTVDDIFLFNGNSQAGGVLIDQESYTTDGVVTYVVPTLTGCPTMPTTPVVECPEDFVPTTPMVTTQCGATFTLTVSAPMLLTGTANCPDATYSIEHEVTDECGNVASCTETFMLDNNPPTIVCPANAVVDCSANIVAGTPIITAACVAPVMTTAGPTLVSGTADCPGAMYELEYTVTDGCMRTATCTQTFTMFGRYNGRHSDGDLLLYVECSRDDIRSDVGIWNGRLFGSDVRARIYGYGWMYAVSSQCQYYVCRFYSSWFSNDLSELWINKYNFDCWSYASEWNGRCFRLYL